MFEDIAAIITPPGIGAIAGLRISGPNAVSISRSQFLSFPDPLTPNRAYFGKFKHGDSGIAIAYMAPHSYTGEDVVEFFTHGSPLSIESLLHSCLSSGARLAAPGEFTLRAFLNGKIDLTQAESIPQIVESESLAALQSATSQLEGTLKRALLELASPLQSALAAIEAWVDFSEEIGELDIPTLADSIQKCEEKAASLLQVAQLSPRQRAGLKIVVVGPPNAGKSSLYNALVREERAIVSPVPGTTRDTLHAELRLNGTRVELIDTAGLRTTTDVIELEGIRRGLSEIATADLVVALYDLSDQAEPWDSLMTSATADHPNVLKVGSKADCKSVHQLGAQGQPIGIRPDIETSALTGDGLDDLVFAMEAMLPSPPPLPFLANERHLLLLARCHSSLASATNALTNEFPIDLLATCLRDALGAIHELTGKGATADILETIFSRFCIGK